MAEPWTVEELRHATERTVALPFMSAALGRDCTLRVRKVARIEYLRLLPPWPAEAKEWPQKDFADREAAWVATLTPEELDARWRAIRRAKYRIIATAALEPVLTEGDVERLGDDVDTVLEALLSFMNEGAASNGA